MLSRHLGRQQAIVLLVSIEASRLTDPSLATNVRNWHSVRSLLRINAVWASENFEPFIVFRSSQLGKSDRKTLAKSVPVLGAQTDEVLR